MDNNKEFQISVADVIAEDPVTNARLFTARTLLNSSLKQDVQSKEIVGGNGSKIQYEYDYGKKISGDLEDCQFKEMFLALTNGQDIKTELQDFWIWDEHQVVEGGKITVSETPLGKVVVENEDAFYELTPTGKTVTVPFSNGTEVICSYQYSTSLETFDIDGEHYGKIIKLTYISRIYNKNGLYKIMQIEIPRFKLDGKMDINLTHDGVSSSKMSGKALEYNGRYARMKMKLVSGQSIPVQNIVCLDQDISLSSGQTKVLSFLGIRGGAYSNVSVANTELSFSSDKTSVATIDTNGTITYKASGIANITATLKSNPAVTDVIRVTCG